MYWFIVVRIVAAPPSYRCRWAPTDRHRLMPTRRPPASGDGRDDPPSPRRNEEAVDKNATGTTARPWPHREGSLPWYRQSGVGHAIPELYRSQGHESFSKFDGWTHVVFLGGTLNNI